MALGLLLIILFMSCIPFSNGSSVNEYQVCSSLHSWGPLKDIRYPFWGDHIRPEFCGLPDFRLSCPPNSSVDYPLLKGVISVRDINTTSHTIVFNRDQNATCFELAIRTNNPFKSGASVANIRLFYGCSTMSGSIQFKAWSFSCSNLDVKASVYYFKEEANGRNCQNNVTIPVSKRAFDDFTQNSKSRTFESVLSEPFEMEYNIESFTACLACQSSGGACGSDLSSPLSEFVCYRPAKGRNLRLFLGLGITGGAILVIALVAFCYGKTLKFCCSNFVPGSLSLGSTSSSLQRGTLCFDVPLFSYKDLEQATNKFHESKELGSGGFGRVYKGKLIITFAQHPPPPKKRQRKRGKDSNGQKVHSEGKLKDGREVAVKQLYEKSYRRVKQFMNEVQILTRLRHQNLVSLYGCTSPQCKELLLVYEYVCNGTVADHLYGKKSSSGYLSWTTRMRIAIETANALSYLHASDIIHRDVKTNNILLDRNFSVKVADFGLSRLFPTDVTHVSTAPQGTPGYLDPEYHQCYQLTAKSDVYSFGVVLLELISSLPAVDMKRQKHEINLSNYAMNRIKQCAFADLVDQRLEFGSDVKVRMMTILVAELAFRCLQHDKEFRPAMDEVLEVLKKIESSDYSQQLEAEEKEVTNHINIVSPPTIGEEDDGARLLISSMYPHDRHQEVHPSSPNSVMDRWGSRSTAASNTSRQGGTVFYRISN